MLKLLRFFYILAQYAVLEMGDESMGEANFDPPT